MPMPMSTEVVDAVVGVNTDHGIPEVQISSPTGTPIAAVSSSGGKAGSGVDSDRDALRVLLSVRQDLMATITEQSTRLRALLLDGDNADAKIARGSLTEVVLASLARRREPRDVPRQRSERHAEIRRLSLFLFAVGREQKANTMQLQIIVNDLVPGLTDRRGIGPVRAAQAIVSLAHRPTVPTQRGCHATASRAQVPA